MGAQGRGRQGVVPVRLWGDRPGARACPEATGLASLATACVNRPSHRPTTCAPPPLTARPAMTSLMSACSKMWATECSALAATWAAWRPKLLVLKRTWLGWPRRGVWSWQAVRCSATAACLPHAPSVHTGSRPPSAAAVVAPPTFLMTEPAASSGASTRSAASASKKSRDPNRSCSCARTRREGVCVCEHHPPLGGWGIAGFGRGKRRAGCARAARPTSAPVAAAAAAGSSAAPPLFTASRASSASFLSGQKGVG